MSEGRGEYQTVNSVLFLGLLAHMVQILCISARHVLTTEETTNLYKVDLLKVSLWNLYYHNHLCYDLYIMESLENKKK